ncbi:MAG TPA: nitroreductase [Trueperaceae bacterium]
MITLPQTVQVLRSRRSVGQPRLVGSVIEDHEVVREALESARWAPNHRHTEPWRFYLLNDERIRALARMNAELLERDGSGPEKVALKRRQWEGVPGVVVFTVCSAADADAVTRREDYAAVACAAQNFMLHLWSEGVASKWSTASVWRHEGFWPLLGHEGDPGEEVVGIFFYGKSSDVPAGRRRLPLEAVLTDFRAAGHPKT